MKKIFITISILLIISLIFVFVWINTSTVITSTNVVLSNKKMGWGVKREKDNKQPNLSIYLNVATSLGGIGIGNAEEKVVYLTFDEGYEAGYTPQILDVLKENNVKACFFLTAHYLNSKPDLIKRIIEEGHLVR